MPRPIIVSGNIARERNVRSFGLAACAGVIAASVAVPASAGEIFGGLYAHDVNTPLTIGDHPEEGVGSGTDQSRCL